MPHDTPAHRCFFFGNNLRIQQLLDRSGESPMRSDSLRDSYRLVNDTVAVHMALQSGWSELPSACEQALRASFSLEKAALK